MIDKDLKDLGVKINKKKLTGRQLFDKKQELFKDAEDAFDTYGTEKKELVEIDEEAFQEEEELPDF